MPSVAALPIEANIQRAIDGEAGYWVGELLSPLEVAELRDLVFQAFLERIAELAPDAVGAFAAAGLKHYHRECYRIDHASAWPRHVRLLGPNAIDYVMNSSLLGKLRAAFGEVLVTNEVEGRGPEIVWRLVRPGAADDVGPLHADSWFWEINPWPIPDGYRCIKVWLMLHGRRGSAGLRVAPGSHLQHAWARRVEFRDGINKPVFDELASGVKTKLLETRPGTAVVFSYDLLHGGAVTEGDECRVSLEFTLFVPRR